MTRTSTVTAIVTTATTSARSKPDQALYYQPTPTPYSLTPPSRFPLLLFVLSIVVLDHFTQRRRLRITTTQQEERRLVEAWQEPWLTKSWSTLYGLIGLAHQNRIKLQHTPFQPKHIVTIQARFDSPQRWALRRLLERGIIPLRINDGGISTTQTATWDVIRTLPFIKLPHYQQTKSRAYLELLIPYPEQAKVKRLINILARNKMGYGISTRTYNPQSHRSQTSTPTECYARNRPRSGPHFPLSVGAGSACEVLLPFLPDTQILQAQGTWVGWLDGCFRRADLNIESRQDGRAQTVERMERGPLRVPLLRHSSWAIVRIEAPHWGYVELDNFVLGAAEGSRMDERWVGAVCEGRAMQELARCGLEV